LYFIKLILYIYFYTLLIFSTYQDFFLVNNIGEIARGGIIIFIPIFIFFEIINMWKSRIIITEIQKFLILFSFGSLLVGLIYSFILHLNGVYFVFGESLFLKQFKGFIYLFVIFLYVRHIYFILSKIGEMKKISNIFFVVNVTLIILLIIEYRSIPFALDFLHSTNEAYYRIRLLTRESSYTGTIWVIYFFLSLYLTRYNSKLFRIIYYIVYLVGFILFIILSGSKGFIIIFIITLAIIIIYNIIRTINQFSLKQYFLLIIVLLAFISTFGYTFEYLQYSFKSDLNDYTSFATRITTIVAAFKIFLLNPFGIGLGNIVYFLPNELLNSSYIVNNFFIKYFGLHLNFNEIYSLVNSDYGLSIKSGLLQWLVYGGILFIYLLYIMIRFTFSVSLSSKFFVLINVFVWFSLLTFIGFEGKYEIWFWISFLEWYKNYKAK
jgi:hypothetical protein